MTNIAIFASGSGSNFENISRHFFTDLSAKVALLVCNKADAFVVTRAKLLGIPCHVVTKSDFNDEYTMMALLRRYDIDFIVLAGFLLMVPSWLINAFPRRIVNIHPSLLPKYGGKGMYGRHVHEAVKAASDTVTGITIHYVSQQCDDGEIIFQATTALSPDDTPDDIAEKVHALEKEHFPTIISRVINQQS